MSDFVIAVIIKKTAMKTCLLQIPKRWSYNPLRSHSDLWQANGSYCRIFTERQCRFCPPACDTIPTTRKAAVKKVCVNDFVIGQFSFGLTSYQITGHLIKESVCRLPLQVKRPYQNCLIASNSPAERKHIKPSPLDSLSEQGMTRGTTRESNRITPP